MTVAAPVSQPGNRFLGIGAKSVHAIKQKKNTEHDHLSAKNIRYNMQRTAQSIMYDREALKQHRVCGCSRNIAGEGVAIYRTVTGDNSRLSGLMTCGSVWACPVCAAKVTEQRRKDLQQAINTWSRMGGFVMLMTLTFPHELDMPLGELLEKFANALKKFKNSRVYKNTFGTAKNPGLFDRAGSVRSLEVTHGNNGWHPHTHDLVFLRNDGLLDDSRSVDMLRSEWAKQLLGAGLGDNTKLNDMLQYGLDLRGGDYAAEYVAKFGHEPKLYEGWNIASEVTKQHSKLSIRDGATPFMLLKWAGEGDAQCAALFKEFVTNFDGKRMNYWSPGLRKMLAISDLTDEEIAQAEQDQQPDEEHVMNLNPSEWRLILETNARAELLIVAAALGKEGVLELLDELPTRRRTHRGDYDINRPKGIWQ